MASTDRKIFRFFDLPRELRNEILSHVQGITRVSKKGNGFSCNATLRFATYQVSMLLVSRQFGLEYQQTIRRDPVYQTASIAVYDVKINASPSPLMQPLLRRRLSELCNLRLCLGSYILHELGGSGSTPAGCQRLVHDMKSLFASMTMLKSIELYSLATIPWLDRYLANVGTVEQLCTLTTDLWLFKDLPVRSNRDIKLKGTLLLVTRLFEANTNCMDALTAKRLNESNGNKIVYICKPSTEVHDYMGLDLEATAPFKSFEEAWAAVTAESLPG